MKNINIQKRAVKTKSVGAQFYSGICLAFVLTVIVVFLVLDRNPVTGLRYYLLEPFLGLPRLSEVLLKMSPLLLMAQALAFGFRAKIWNIGAEGQLLAGAITASLVPILLSDALGDMTLVVMFLAAMAGGMICAAIPAYLKANFNANEVLVTLMLNSIVLQLLYYLVAGPLRDPDGFNWPQSAAFPGDAMLPTLFAGMRVNISVFFGLVATVIAWYLVTSSFWAYKLRVAGMAPDAAKYAGFSGKSAIWVTLLIGGAAAGIAGMGEIAGPIGQLQRVISPGYGFTAIIIAFLGGLRPVGILVASFLFAALSVGGDLAQAATGLPYFATKVIEGTIFVSFLAGRFFIDYQLTCSRPVLEESKT